MSKSTSEKIIFLASNVSVQNGDMSLIEGSLTITKVHRPNHLRFDFHTDTKHTKIVFAFCFSSDDLTTIHFTYPIQKYTTITFTTKDETKKLPSLFIPRGSDIPSAILNTIIEHSECTVVPKDDTPDVYLVHKRLGSTDDFIVPHAVDLNEIKPVGLKTVMSYSAPDGSFSKESEEDIRKTLYISGVEADARPFVWKLVLEYYPFSSTSLQRAEIDQKKKEQYYKIKSQWQLFEPEQLHNWDTLMKTLNQIEKDVTRTDNNKPIFMNHPENVEKLRSVLKTYAIYNFKVLYGQGMSDLCSLVMNIATEEHEIFWLFKLVMDVISPYYLHDENLRKKSFDEVGQIIKFVNPGLYDYFERTKVEYSFCYKWIVLLFKRDFEPAECLRVWDFFFAYPKRKLYLFFTSAIILEHAKSIVQEQKTFSGMIELLQNLHKKIPAELIFSTDIIFQQFSQLANKEVYADLLK
ncbi:hypothetical protein EIN_312800 [Entamoeba invadens IP1]|uniref:Rab-GAP TBC domain-containing protein n=1 Tax=Entamoeba invadens IP1 TaxID=370355 RepID=A0A0A1UGP8_ENTIV|nr:hypothetical protein EIN_312800 [Entamoeba invadens IP1]ELP92908.1 hypothetical protein EIN_312800 [Entamoeba invadens IP1]|eukprot:XP_004259679.1 hypothetical protein EIN_312800 [Entamoeba invadens IP1]